MSNEVYLMMILSGICVISSTITAWHWILPIVESISHRNLSERIIRLSQLGYREKNVRRALMLSEVSILVSVVYLAVHVIGWFLGGAALMIFFHARSLVLDAVIQGRERLLRQQINLFAGDLSHLAHGGLSLHDALADASSRTPRPLGPFVRRIVIEHRRGRPLREAIDSIRSGLQLDAFSLLVTALNNVMTRGCSLTGSLVGVTETLSNATEIEQLLASKTSAGKTTVMMLSAMPMMFMGMAYVGSPENFNHLTRSSVGQQALAVVLLLTYTGCAWSRKLLNPKL
jgi:Flp pilus assembly protein TadB